MNEQMGTLSNSAEKTSKLGEEYNKLKSEYEQINSANQSYLEELRELREITVSNN